MVHVQVILEPLLLVTAKSAAEVKLQEASLPALPPRKRQQQ